MYPRTLSLPDATLCFHAAAAAAAAAAKAWWVSSRTSSALRHHRRRFLSVSNRRRIEDPPPAAERGGFRKGASPPHEGNTCGKQKGGGEGEKKFATMFPLVTRIPVSTDTYSVQRLEGNEAEFETRVVAPLARCTTAPPILYESVIARGYCMIVREC